MYSFLSISSNYCYFNMIVLLHCEVTIQESLLQSSLVLKTVSIHSVSDKKDKSLNKRKHSGYVCSCVRARVCVRVRFLACVYV